jgi:outer membrane lipoprotein-sorting protein
MKGTAILGLSVLGFLALSLQPLSALTGEEILARMDRNKAFKTISYTAKMTISQGSVVRTKTMKAKATSDGKAIVEFTNAEDKGIKYLKLDKNLWIYYPEEDDTVPISGHLLKEGMMGSDVSYEDALEQDALAANYGIEVSSTDASVESRPCYLVTLTAKTDTAPYQTRKIWVDKETFVGWKTEMYAKSGLLLKISEVLDTRKIGGADFAVKVRLTNALVPNRNTVFEMKDVVLNPALDPSLFGKRFLSR